MLFIRPFCERCSRVRHCLQGALEVFLDPKSCFSAEAYAVDLGLHEVDPDKRLNLGENFASAVFSQRVRPGSGTPEGFTVLVDPSHLTISSRQESTTRLSCRADHHLRMPTDEAALWLAHCLVHDNNPHRDSSKLSFLLLPHENSGLAKMPAGANRLSAPRALKASRLAAHVERTLRHGGATLGPGELQATIQLFCGGKPLTRDVSLLSVRTFCWRQGGDMVLTYAESQGARLEMIAPSQSTEVRYPHQ